MSSGAPSGGAVGVAGAVVLAGTVVGSGSAPSWVMLRNLTHWPH